jgi:flagellar basal-body rod protein FlgF
MTGYAESALVRGISFLADKQAAIANNLANVDTASFKRRFAVASESRQDFQSMLDQQLSTITYTEKSDLGRGIIRETGNSLDLALDGPLWMRVQNNAGATFYTRNGQLQISGDGKLVTRDGLAVLDQNGVPIQIGTGGDAPSEITVSPNGTIQDPVTGQNWGPIAVVSLPDADALTPIGKSLYIDPKQQHPTQVSDGVQQGFLEGSNVDSLQELVAMIAVERSFTATQKALSGIGRLHDNLIDNILR